MLIVLIDYHAPLRNWLGYNVDKLPNADLSH